MSVVNRIFAKIDDDNSGSITKDEMDGVFTVFDKDGDGTVSKAEWEAGFVSTFGGTAEQATKVFAHLDSDKSGDISLDEIGALFKQMDTDGNGSVDKDEFSAVWNKLLS